jgi:hypothetical protein
MKCLVDLTKDPYRFAFVYYVVLVISEELKGTSCEEAGKPRVPIKILGMYGSFRHQSFQIMPWCSHASKASSPRYFLFRGVD